MFEKFKKNKEVMNILNKLNSNTSTGYIVGGAVRDILLGLEPNDIDFATNRNYEEVKELFSEFKCNETGKAFGVLRIKTSNDEYEIAKYRQDITSDEVEFVNNIKGDLSRRDFTINAMAWNDNEGLVDLFNGKRDIYNKVLRFVGNAEERIKEDPLRMLRAVRFIAKTGFTLDEESFNAIQNNGYLINTITKERIHDEFTKLMKLPNYIKSIDVMKETGLLSEIIPEIKVQYNYNQNNPHHSLDLWTHTRSVVDNCKNSDYITRLSALFHDIGKPSTQSIDEITGFSHYYKHETVGAKMIGDILDRLKFTNEEKYNITALVENHMVFHRSEAEKTIRKMIHNIGKDNTRRLAELSFADDEGKFKKKRHNELLLKVNSIIDTFNVPKVSDLKLNGYELKEMGYEGLEIGKVKKYLLSRILDEGIPNEREKLLEILHNDYEKNDIE